MRRYARLPAAPARRRAARRGRRCRPPRKPDGRARAAAGSRPTRCRPPTRAAATLAVPLDPAAPDGPTIEIFVARLARLERRAAPRSAALDRGGPGQSTVDFYLQLRGAFEPARRDRDLILVDQRGTGRSAEGFACEVPEDLSLDTAGTEELARVVDACVARARPRPALLYDVGRRSRPRARARGARHRAVERLRRVVRHARRAALPAPVPRATCARSCSTASCRRRSRSGPTSRAKRSARSSKSSRAARPTRSAARGSRRCRSSSPRCSRASTPARPTRRTRRRSARSSCARSCGS